MRALSLLVTTAVAAIAPGNAGPEITTVVAAPSARIAAAKAAPCSTAITLYASISADTALSDTIRAQAFSLLADYAFALREYETARDNYKKASALDKKNPRYVYRSGLSLLANGDSADAIKAMTLAAGRNEPVVSNEARVVLGRLSYAKGDYRAAMDHFRQTGDFSPTNSWSIAAGFGKLMCSRALGLSDSAGFYEKQLAPYSRSILEKQWIAKPKPGAAVIKADTVTAQKSVLAILSGKNAPIAGTDDSTAAVFTLQVGAFASDASALALKKRLAKNFKEVSCVTAIISTRTFYRVWVGTFKTREAAEKFGRDELMELGLVFRVVAK